MSDERRLGLERREFLRIGATTGALALLRRPAALAATGSAPQVEEATVADLQRRMGSGDLTARGLTQAYLDRIDSIDRRGPTLRSVIESNPDALAIADALDHERREKGPRGPLH